MRRDARQPALHRRGQGRLRRQAGPVRQRLHRAGQRDDPVHRRLPHRVPGTDARLHRQRVGQRNRRLPRGQNGFRGVRTRRCRATSMPPPSDAAAEPTPGTRRWCSARWPSPTTWPRSTRWCSTRPPWPRSSTAPSPAGTIRPWPCSTPPCRPRIFASSTAATARAPPTTSRPTCSRPPAECGTRARARPSTAAWAPAPSATPAPPRPSRAPRVRSATTNCPSRCSRACSPPRSRRRRAADRCVRCGSAQTSSARRSRAPGSSAPATTWCST